MKSLGGFVYHWAEMPLSKEELAAQSLALKAERDAKLKEAVEKTVEFAQKVFNK